MYCPEDDKLPLDLSVVTLDVRLLSKVDHYRVVLKGIMSLIFQDMVGLFFFFNRAGRNLKKKQNTILKRYRPTANFFSHLIFPPADLHF